MYWQRGIHGIRESLAAAVFVWHSDLETSCTFAGACGFPHDSCNQLVAVSVEWVFKTDVQIALAQSIEALVMGKIGCFDCRIGYPQRVINTAERKLACTRLLKLPKARPGTTTLRHTASTWISLKGFVAWAACRSGIRSFLPPLVLKPLCQSGSAVIDNCNKSSHEQVPILDPAPVGIE